MRLGFTSTCVLLVAAFSVGAHASPNTDRRLAFVHHLVDPPFNDDCNPLTSSYYSYCSLFKPNAYPVSRGYLEDLKFSNAATIANDIAFHAKTCVMAANALVAAQKSKKKNNIRPKTEAFEKGKKIHLTAIKLYESTEMIIPKFWDGKKTYSLNEESIQAFDAFLATTYDDIEKQMTYWEKRHKFARAKVAPDALDALDEATVHGKCLTLTKKFFDDLIVGLRGLLKDGKRSEDNIYRYNALKTDLKVVLDGLREDIFIEILEDVPPYYQTVGKFIGKDGRLILWRGSSSRSGSIPSVFSDSSAKSQ